MAELNDSHGLEASIPANNSKIIEIYNKLRNKQISVNKSYQRKLVWKDAHKLNFIDTILRNYPFPEVYLAPGSLDQVKLILIDEIVDGQQRLTTIQDYIEGTDVFARPKISIKRFSELSSEEKNTFLNYEISVRYLKNVTPDQVKEIFQRINKTDYALNAAERLNAQWGDSEFVCFAKQIVDAEFDDESLVFIIEPKTRKTLADFFHGKGDDEEGVFSDNDKSRMLAYQYIMTLIATLDQGEYFNRNEKISQYIEAYNDAFPKAAELLTRLLKIVNFISTLKINRNSRWYKKANLFTLIVELDKIDIKNIDSEKFSEKLSSLDHRSALIELGFNSEPEDRLTPEEEKYLGFAREAVNQKNAREYRGDFINKLIIDSIKA
ncbi:DUF262 domain-containing protein [Janthinobacterium sp. BJB401]|uniref:DUF262 domain-containing protein n=1 Tax=Janthinobacterium sp. BJB401 TaxID=2745934 RepID=UPI001595823D|nr:DUF262 domain-containing protein [Janthinobacterium sp. BJB401]NVI82910.1 DUF262 domain-containing protein [Janthinobacterium sp. BJB401]